MEVEAAQHNADIWVKQAAVGDVGEVLRLDVATEGWVCSADVWDTLGFQLLLRVANLRAGAFDLVLTLLLAILFVACLVLVLRSRAIDRARRPTDLVE